MYKKGDKFEIEIEEVIENGTEKGNLYRIKGFSTLVFDDYGLNLLNKSEEEPEVDWSTVAIDTPVLVRDDTNAEWHKRYFAKYNNGCVYAWSSGSTSWACDRDFSKALFWRYGKLAEVEE